MRSYCKVCPPLPYFFLSFFFKDLCLQLFVYTGSEVITFLSLIVLLEKLHVHFIFYSTEHFITSYCSVILQL